MAIPSEVERALRYCPNLPSLSGVALRIVELGRDPEVSLESVAAVLRQDPALAAKIVRVANSPLYRQRERRQSANLRQALMILGLNAVMTLALSFSLAGTQRGSRRSGVDLPRVWRRSLLAALAARLLGEECGLQSLEELFLAGLLQDLGLLALDAALPDRYAPVAQARSHDEQVQLERELLAVDHSAVTGWLLLHWGMPEYLATTARESHALHPARIPAEMLPFTACVNISGALADLYLDHAPDELHAPAYSVAKAAERWLGLEQSGLQRVLTRLGETLPAIEALFEFELLAPEQLAGITDQAREILAARSLELLHLAAHEHEKAQRLEKERDLLQDAVHRDALTGLRNRRYLELALPKQFEQANALDAALSIAFLDIDHFKTINDTYGHAGGDAVLTAVAALIQRQLRTSDEVVRYGGEEFIVILPGAGRDAAQAVCERLRYAIEAMEHRLDSGEALSITASIGVCTHSKSTERYPNAQALIAAADQALYAAKHQGRNRVEVQESDVFQ